MEIPFNTHDYISLALETEEGEDGGGTREGGGENAPPTKMEDVQERPSLQEENSDQLLEDPINLFWSISVSSALARVKSKNLPAS